MKKLLLIMPKMYGYESVIKETYEKQGYYVDVIFENFYSIHLGYKIILKTKIISKENIFWLVYLNKLKKNAEYTDVLIIRGSSITTEIVEYIKKNSPNAKFFMYQWDSIRNNQTVLKIASYFDAVKTFDMYDAKQYGWKYVPLFFINDSIRNSKRRFDYAYICTNHSERIKIYNKLIEQYNNASSFIYYYIGVVEYIKNKYFNKSIDFREVNRNSFYFKPISTKEANLIMSNSAIVIDYTHPNQNGFTMRTIESLGHRCKLITNNKNILDADFYNPNNIYVYEMDDFKIPDSFFESDYIEIDEEIRKKYSIEEWCKELVTV